jgi:hypothetical protein
VQLCLVSSSPSKAGNSVLSTTLSPRRWTQQFATPLLWEVGFLPHHCSQCLSSPCLHLLKVWLLAPPQFCEVGSMLHLTPTVSGRLKFTQLCSGGRGSICPGAALDYVPMGWMGVLCVVCGTHLLGLQIIRHLWNQPTGRNGGVPLFSRQTLNGTGFSPLRHR